MKIVIGCKYVTAEMAKKQFGDDVEFVQGDERGALLLADRKLQPARIMLRNIARRTIEVPKNSSYHFFMCIDDFTLWSEKGIRKVMQRSEQTLRAQYSDASFKWIRFDFTNRKWSIQPH